MTEGNPSDLPPPWEEAITEPQSAAAILPDGSGVASFRNVRTALAGMPRKFRFNRRTKRALMSQAKSTRMVQIDEKQLSKLRQEFIKDFGFDPKKEPLWDSVMSLAFESEFDPVCDYLNKLKWDGVARLKDWLSEYLGVKSTAFTRAIGQIVLIAAVRRARRPGCRFDTILVLIGGQGSGKSRAINMLAVRPSWFSDQELLHLAAQQQQEQLEGIWIYELSELGGLQRTSVDKAKAFVSRRTDRARRAYGRFRADAKRMCIFIATTNDDLFLRDPTGNRRFWPVEVGRVRLKALKANVDQLWAEAAAREKAKESIQLPRRLWRAAARAQNRRVVQHGWVTTLAGLEGKQHGAELRVSYADVFERLGLAANQRTAENMTIINACMAQNGWRRAERPFKYRGKTCRGFSKRFPEPEVTA